MTIKPGVRDFVWMASGAAVLLVLTLTVRHFYEEQNPAEQVAFRTRRIELVDGMRLALASASEAELTREHQRPVTHDLLNRKRNVTLACQETLAALRKAIDEEPIAGVTYGRPEKPR